MKKLFPIVFSILILTGISVTQFDSAFAQTPSPTPSNFKVAFIGDQGYYEDDAELVLQLIASESTDMVLHQGDFDYNQNPTDWDDMITDELGLNFPYFASVGNHDLENGQWPNYQQKLQERLDRVNGATCTGDLGNKSSCHYQGLFFILSGIGTIGSGTSGTTLSEHLSYIQTELAQDDSIWSFCTWHKNHNQMQVGGKSTEVSMQAYDACREGGAIVATGHEHSYSRTKTLTNMASQTVDPAWTDPGEVRVAEGATFAFVSGLGGKSVRDQERCLPQNYPYGCNGEWASIYSLTQDSRGMSGALFCEFNHNGQENKAFCYFKNTDGQTIDQFNVTSQVGVEIPQEPPVAYDQPDVSTFENIPIDITLLASDANNDPLTYSIVSNPSNGSLTGSGDTRTYTPNPGFNGNDSFTFKANDGIADSNTATVSITVDSIPDIGTLNIRVSTGSDDAEQRLDTNAVNLVSTDLELTQEAANQIVGMRFQGVIVPQGAEITTAYVEFETDEADSVSTSLTIRAQDSDDTSTFTTATNNISNRATTSASVGWNPPAWNTVSEKHQTPEIKSVIQEVVNRTGWAPGNSMVIIIDGTGSRTAESYNGESANAPLLHIEYNNSPPPNNPPTANAGADQNVDENTNVNLDGSGSSDSDGTISSYFWAQESGTLVLLDDNTIFNPSFTAPGVSSTEDLVFSLEVTDDDGAKNSDTITITVNPTNEVIVEEFVINTSGNKRWTGFVTTNVTSGGAPVENATVIGEWSGGASGSANCATNSGGICEVSKSTKQPTLTFTVLDITGVGIEYDPSANDSITFDKDGNTPGVNTPPVAADDNADVQKGSSIIIDVVDNDTDDGTLDLSSITITQAPSNDLSLVDNGDGTLTYTHDDTDTISDSFKYTINDNEGETSNEATVSITINEPVPTTLVHVDSLVGSSSSKGPWTTFSVTITIHDHDDPGTLHSGVLVSGDWNGGAESDSCTTVDGSCSLSYRIKSSAPVTFDVTDLSGDDFDRDFLDHMISIVVP